MIPLRIGVALGRYPQARRADYDSDMQGMHLALLAYGYVEITTNWTCLFQTDQPIHPVLGRP